MNNKLDRGSIIFKITIVGVYEYVLLNFEKL